MRTRPRSSPGGGHRGEQGARSAPIVPPWRYQGVVTCDTEQPPTTRGRRLFAGWSDREVLLREVPPERAALQSIEFLLVQGDQHPQFNFRQVNRVLDP